MKTEYRRLPGTGHRHAVPGWAIFLLFFCIGIFALLLRGPRVQLWTGKDHLLQVEWTGYLERYKRFRYADIQALVFRQTQVGKILNIAWVCFALLFGTIAMNSLDSGFAAFWIVLALGSFGALLLNLYFGPTCKCYLRTAVQLEQLFSITRIKQAYQVFGIVRPLIQASQADAPSATFATESSPPETAAPMT